MAGRPKIKDPVRALELIAEAAREYAKFVVFRPDRAASVARERLQAALADYDELIGGEGTLLADTPEDKQ